MSPGLGRAPTACAHSRSRRRLGALPLVLAQVLALALLAAACADGGEPVAGDRIDPPTSAVTITIQAIDGQPIEDGDTILDELVTPAPAPAPDPSICGPDRVNRQPFYGVANIPDDDPDGGLNLRDDYGPAGTRLDTLPELTVVHAVDCAIADDGGVWYAVETGDGQAGWVNAAFLSQEISPGQPAEGGAELEVRVRAVLDALAARRWDEAAAELRSAPGAFEALVSLFEADPGAGQDDLPRLLDTYCQIRLCDAPYTVVDARDSYLPDLVSPEVDVRFDYPAGSTVETFRWIRALDGRFTLDTLPGRSNLAWTVNRPTAADLADPGDPAPAGLLEAAEAIRQALLSEDGPALLAPFVTVEGTAVSSSAYLQPRPEDRVVIVPDDLADADVTATDGPFRIWGYTDGVGAAIVDTVPGWLGRYRRSAALLDPDEVSVDRRVGASSTIANLEQLYPDAHVVEFHRRGRGELADFNWSSIRLALEERQGRWALVGLTADTWTI